MTHKQRVLQLLSDNEPHGHMEGYRLGVMLHSRVADLRKDGYTIKCWAEGGQYLYQLFGAVRGPEVVGIDGDPTGAQVHGPPPPSGGPLRAEPPSLSPQFERESPAGPGSPLPVEPQGQQLLVWEAAA